MLQIKKFTFNPFQENTYLIYNENGDTIVIDPGCYTPLEKQTLADFIEQKKLKPTRLINSHCHIDHVLGNPFVSKKYNLLPEFHKAELPLLLAVSDYGMMWGIQSEIQPGPEIFLNSGEKIFIGDDELEIIFTPGHSPAELSFINHQSKFVIAGDVLFRESIGRTDLPGGNLEILLHSIRTELFKLPVDYTVYAGHGPETTIGHEKAHNPFLH